MSAITRRTYVVVGDAEPRSRRPEPPHRTGTATLIFYRGTGEGIRHPSDVVELLNAEGVETGTIRARNPITHDQWWIPVTALAAAGAPYAKALGSVVSAWIRGRRRRQVRLEIGGSKIAANSIAEVESLLAALTKQEKQLGLLCVTKAPQPPAKKKAPAKRKKKL